MGARFSGTDNQDETGLKLYGVVGKLEATPVVKLRIGVYGYFKELLWNEVFDGALTGAVENEREEVICEDDLPNILEDFTRGDENPNRRLWWDRILRRRGSVPAPP